MEISSNSGEGVASKIKSILESAGISEPVSKVVVSETGLRGENFASLILHVAVHFEPASEAKQLNLFVKLPPMNPRFRQMIQSWRFFEKEAVFFMEYLPKAREYCKGMGHEWLTNIYPKSYHLDGELVVLENVVLERGFILLDKIAKQDFGTATLALTNLAKHHAMSYALIEEYGGAEPFFGAFPDLQFEFFGRPSSRLMKSPKLERTLSMVIDMLENSEQVEGKEEAIHGLRAMKGKQFDMMLESLKPRCGEFLVLNHGDVWNNNMLFRVDKKSGQVVEQVMIDFQTVRYGSPCIDLGYYLYMSVKPEVRRERLDELLRIYLAALKETGRLLNHSIDLSFEVLETDFLNHFQFGYWRGLDVATGAGYVVMKDMELSELGMEDPLGWADRRSTLVEKWMEAHPEECAHFSQIYVDYWREYEQLARKSAPHG